MNISLRWLNQYLDPGDISAEDADHVLTHAGFPIEGHEEVGGSDVMLDVELTSNRGDCLSHVGLAREIAAATGRRLVLPQAGTPATGGAVSERLKLTNREPGACPLFTARVIRGVKVGPSPDWLVRALEAVGQRSINNVVDVTNYITFELGNPCHVFDLKKLAGGELVVRFAKEGEKLTTLDGKARVLKATEIVVADAQRAQSLGGVIGGADSEVDRNTTDVVFEMATWDPATIRAAARRMNIRTDAGHRFERIVDARTIHAAAQRAVALLVELAGGTLCEGVLSEGRALNEATIVEIRPGRCSRILGYEVTGERIAEILTSLGLAVNSAGERLRCEVPAWRPDLTREIDLIEEVARINGFEKIEIAERLPVVVSHPQEHERAVREVGSILSGLGFYETVTFSFCRPEQAPPFLGQGESALSVDDERRGAEPTLRPSPLTGLLSCRKANQDAGAETPGGVRLFEIASAFVGEAGGAWREPRTLALLVDVPDVARGKRATPEQRELGVRIMRGAVESLCRAMCGKSPGIEPVPTRVAAYDAGACARIVMNQSSIGVLGLLSDSVLQAFGIDAPLVAAELDAEALVRPYPPMRGVRALPAFPPIDRDLSFVVPEQIAWADVQGLVEGLSLDRLEDVSFVGVYRGKPLDKNTKSVTVRLRFRDESRTMRHEEVDGTVQRVVDEATAKLGATLRA